MNEFQPMEFATLLKHAIGLRTAKQFAEESGISKYYISRRLTCQYDAPPRKSTLSTIAQHSQGRVSLEQLLICCGYKDTPEKASETQSEKKNASGNIRQAKACILSSISDRHIPCMLDSKEAQIPCDFELSIGDGSALTWDFKCLPDNAGNVVAEQELREGCLSLIFTRLRAYSKLSFITGREDVFEHCSQMDPVNLNAETSLILLSEQTLEVIKEKTLSRSITDPLPAHLSSLLT